MSYFTDITVHPQSVNTTLNSTVNFTCEAFVDTITFRVNDEPAIEIGVMNRGFVQQPPNNLSDDRIRRVLLAKALEDNNTDNNNTNISCRAVKYKKNSTITSDIAVLRIQGELML